MAEVAITPWSVYLLECRGGCIYTGIAVDVDARFQAHLSGRGARFTRSHPPQRLLVQFTYPDRGSALRVEAAIKRLPASAKREIAAGSRQPPTPPDIKR